MKKIVIIGSLNMDFVIDVENYPKMGETVLGKGMELKPGGKGANQAYAAAVLGADVTMLGAVGDDDSGQKLIQNLNQTGVHTEYIKVISGVSTGAAFVSVDREGDNCIIVIQGANKYVDKEYIQSVSQIIAACDIVVFQLEIPLETVMYAADLAKSMGKIVILDPAPVQCLPKEFLSGLDIVKPNRTELIKLLGRTEELEEGLRLLQEMGVKNAIVTLGKEGCLLRKENGNVIYSPAFKMKAIDTTGAGDCFTAALAYCLANDFTLEKALEFAQKASAISVTRKGTQNSYPTLTEILETDFSRNGVSEKEKTG